jgi:threonine/homoserine/homoserine lactone efflux protein
VVPFLLAVLPSAGVLFLFWLAIKALVEADRRERLAQARLEHPQKGAGKPARAVESPQDHDGDGA